MTSESHLPPTDVLLEHAAWVSRLARHLIRDREEAEDAVQDTWLAFLRLRPDRERPLRPWLARVVRNQAAYRLRKGSALRERESTSARPEAVVSAHEIVARGEVQREVVNAVLGLDEPYRSTLLLRYYEGLEPREIASLKGLAPATVRTHISRGHQRLREILDESHGSDGVGWRALLVPLGLPRGLPSAALPQGTSGVAAGTWLCAAAACAVLFGAWLLSFPWTGEPTGLTEPIAKGRPDAPDSTGATLSPLTAPLERSAAAESRVPRLAVQLVNSADGRPLADYLLLWEGQSATSDHDGRVTLSSGWTEASAVDTRANRRSFVENHGLRKAGPVPPATLLAKDLRGDQLAIEAGPTLRLRLECTEPLDFEQLTARLGPIKDAGYHDHGRPILETPVRRGPDGKPWVRFPALRHSGLSIGARCLLEVRDRAGFLHGSRTLDLGRTPIASVLSLALEPTARIEGALTVSKGTRHLQSDFEGVSVAVMDTAGVCVANARPDPTGKFAMGWIHGGPHRCVVDSSRFVPSSAKVALHGGETKDLQLSLEARATDGAVSGEVLAPAMDFSEQLLVFARSSGGELLGVYPTTWATQKGRRVAKFAFEDLPQGPVDLDVVSLGSAITFDGPVAAVAPPFFGVVLTLRTAVPAHDFEVAALCASTADPIPAFRFEASLNGGPTRSFDGHQETGEPQRWTLSTQGLRWNEFDGPAPLRRLPDSATVQWTLRAKGYEAVSGSEADASSLGNGKRQLIVHLQPAAQDPDPTINLRSR